MALSEPQVNDISDDQEANELFNTFMDITRHEANMDHQPNTSSEIEKDKQQSKLNDTVEKEENTEMPAKESEEKTVELKNDNENDLPAGAKGDVSKSLSEAVNELSDLEKQLSLMISVGPKHCTKSDNVSSTSDVAATDNGTVIDTGEGGVIISVNEDESHDAKESELMSTKSKDRETLPTDEDADRKVDTEVATEFKGDNGKETSEKENHANVDEAENVEVMGSTDISTKSNEGDIKETGSESVHEDASQPQSRKESTEVLTKSNEDGIKETGTESVHEEDASKLQSTDDAGSNDVNVEEKMDEIVKSNDLANEETPADHAASEQENFDQKNNNVEKPDAKVQKDIKQDEAVDGKPGDTKEEGSKESSPEVKDDNADRKSSSAAEIEILMTDESGISERKSLDSLDSLNDTNHNGRPDSPALSDEGIDSDSKSDIGDEDTFDTSSSDFSMKSKTSLLEVDRNRTGSDSSTFSEQEFKRDLPDKTDGVIGEGSGNN